ncbi:ANR family transcriptional regulator [Salmonella enterica subsp. enterica]|nr:ANR family transcriptional regulator [Salmonella enterica subsp. enterica serovar Newport]EDE8445045.1 ANR family transcriptional regulator [Salmonella enterica subsp. enterica serovar Pomona]
MAMRVNEYAAKNQYAAYATGAGRAERNGEYGKAAELWHRAAASPCSSLRRQWAQARAAFCENAHIKGWRLSDEGKGV